MFVSATVETSNALDHYVKTELQVVTAGYAVIEEGDVGPNRPFGWPDYQLLYIKEGIGHFMFNGEETVLSAGTAVIFHPNEPQIYHYLQKEHPKTYWIHIGGSLMDTILKNLGIHNKRIFEIIDDDSLINAVHLTIDELITQKKGYQEAAIAQAIQAFVCVARNEERRPKNTFQHAAELARIKIRREYTSDTTNAEYAAEFNMSVSHFLYLFKELTGTTPQNYKLRVRISSAKNMLINTKYKITDIAQIVGFNDSMYFCKYFRKTVGCTPSEFRKKNQD